MPAARQTAASSEVPAPRSHGVTDPFGARRAVASSPDARTLAAGWLPGVGVQRRSLNKSRTKAPKTTAQTTVSGGTAGWN